MDTIKHVRRLNLWAFSIYKKFPKISIGNFRLGRARSICHKSQSIEPREAWPLKDRERYGTGVTDEKSVNGTQIFIGKFPAGKRDYLFRNFKKSYTIYISNGISGIFW